MSADQNEKAIEAFDIALAASAFYDDITTIFIDDGVWLLHKKQSSAALHGKSITAQLQALPLYEIPMYASVEALQQRDIDKQDIIVGVQYITDYEIQALLKSAGFIWN